jgi:hypothetical protein
MECRLSDEQVRSYVGERLASIDGSALSPDEKTLYDSLMFRSEFMNQEAFRIFDEDCNENRITAVIEADAALVAAAKNLNSTDGKLGDTFKAIGEAFDRRDAAMSQP